MISVSAEDKAITLASEDGIGRPQTPTMDDKEAAIPSVVDRPATGGEDLPLASVESHSGEDTPPPSYVPPNVKADSIASDDGNNSSQREKLAAVGEILIPGAIGAAGGYMLAPPLTLGALNLVGFGATGIVKGEPRFIVYSHPTYQVTLSSLCIGSVAALAHSMIGNVAAGSGFSFIQIITATAVTPPVVAFGGAAGGAVIVGGGCYLAKTMWGSKISMRGD